MADAAREAWITGIGVVSCLGEGPQAHWQGLIERRINVDGASFAPYLVHPLAPIDFSKQIPRRNDQRQMEPWQRIGTYAAGLALDSAGISGKAEMLARTDMIVVASGGERDRNVDCAILTDLLRANEPESLLNARLMTDLRPTLFLAQLANLLAGNISIVHGVTGSSCTFLGEEAAGVNAVRVSLNRIAAGQSDIALVGGAQNCEREDFLLPYEFGSILVRDRYRPVWQRTPQGGIILASLGAFLVIEERGHAEARGCEPWAKISAVVSDRSELALGVRAAMFERMWGTVEPRLRKSRYAALSGASGLEPATSQERAFLAGHPALAVRATGSLIGHSNEPQFLMNLALAALTLRHAELFSPDEGSDVEEPMDHTLSQLVVTSAGIGRGVAMALVEAVE